MILVDIENLEEEFDLKVAYHAWCEDPICREQHRWVNIFEVKQFIEDVKVATEEKMRALAKKKGIEI